MTDLVTLQQAQDHLRNYYDAEIPDIQLRITQASAIVLDYIKAPTPTPYDTTNVPAVIQAAVLLTMSWLYEDRSGGLNPESTRPPVQEIALGYLPPSITDILHRYRDPACA
jgi:hypothetical protein